MAREKAVIEKEWKAAEKGLEEAIKVSNSSMDLDQMDERLPKTYKPWEMWQKLLAEATKKISEKDWKDDKKLPADRQAFKKWVTAQGSKKKVELEKAILGLKTKYANLVKANKDAESGVKNLRAEFAKSVSQYAKDKDIDAAQVRVEFLADKMEQFMSAEGVKKAVFMTIQTAFKEINEHRDSLDKAQKERLKVTGDVDKITYESIRKDPKLLQRYLQYSKRPELLDFLKQTDFGKKGNDGVYQKYVKPNLVNIPADLLAEFTTIATSEKPNWAGAPWGKVMGHVDKMLNDNVRIGKFKEMLTKERSAG